MTIKKIQKRNRGRVVWRTSLLVMICTLLLLPNVSAAETLTPTVNTALSTDITKCLTLTVTNTQGTSCGSVTYDSDDTITLIADYDFDNFDVTTTTLTIASKNNRDVDIVYTVDKGDEQSTTIPANSSFEISVTADSGGNAQSKVICIVSVSEDSAVYVPTFAANPNGSYTVDEKVITSDYTPEEAIEGAYKLVPGEAADGYEFFGWYGSVNGAYTANADGSLDYKSGTVETVYALFVPTDCAIYTVGSKQYAYLDHAITGTNGSGQITVTGSGKVYHSLGEKTFTIPAGVDLLVPFGSGDTGTFSETPTNTYFGFGGDQYLAPIYNASDYSTTYPTLSYSHAYCTLTVPTDTVINLSGRMNVNSQIHSNGARDTGCPHGPYGLVVLEHGARLNILSDGTLYCYGWIMGTFNSKNEYTGGQVVADAGANVFELFQIRDWRGGTATTIWMNQSTLSFPISQYYIQNIEAEYIIHTNANSSVVFDTGSGGGATLTAKAVGSGDDCLFKLTAGYIIRTYDPTTERIAYRLCKDGATAGAMALSSIKLTLGTEEINSALYILPLNSNMTITIGNGCSASITYKVKLLPGAQLIVEKGATVTVPSTGALYIYDKSDWNASYTFWASSNTFQDVGNEGTTINDNRNTQRMVVRYSPSRAAIYGASTAVTARTYGSAQVRVDGTLTANGNVFATNGYATATTDGALYSYHLTGYTNNAGSSDVGKALIGTGTFTNNTSPSQITYYYYKKTSYTLWVGIDSYAWYTSVQNDNYSNKFGRPYSGDDFTLVFTAVTHYGQLDEFYGSRGRVQIPCTPVVGFMATSADTVPTTYSNFGASTYYGTYYDKDSDGVEESGEFFWYQTPNTTVNMLDKASGSTVDTWTTFFFSGTTPSGYYTDAACTTTGIASTVYTLAEAYIVRTDGTEYYQTVNKAVKDSCSDETVYIIRDLTLTEGIVVPYDKNVILDLNGKTVSYAGTVLTNKGTLTLQNGTLSNTKTDGDAYTGSAIRNIDTIDSIGGTITINTATASAGSAILNHGGKIETIGGVSSTVVINAAYYGIQLTGSGARIDFIGGDADTEDSSAKVTVNSYHHTLYVTSGTTVHTIGGKYSDVKFILTTDVTGARCALVEGTIDLVGGTNSKVRFEHNFTPTSGAIHLFRVAGGTVNTIGGDNAIVQMVQNSNSTQDGYGLILASGGKVGIVGGSNVTAVEIIVRDYPIYVASGCEITEIAEGTLFVGKDDSTYGVLNQYKNNNGIIGKISGGYYGRVDTTNIDKSIPVYYRPSIIDGYALSQTTKSVTSYDGDSYNCYYLVQHTHSYTATYDWADDHSSCTVTATCSGCVTGTRNKTLTGEATVTSATTDATCTVDGKTVYTATVTLNGTEYSDTYTEAIAAVGHQNTELTGAAEPTCTEDGYTGDRVCLDCEETIEKGVGIPAAHSYGDEVTYAWTDYTSCTASRTCTVCTEETEGHTETVNATITSEVTTAATCTTAGEKTHTATFDVDWATEQTETETIPALGFTDENEDGTCDNENCNCIHFYKANVNLGNDLDMMFAFPKDDAVAAGGSYVKIVRTYTDGRDAVTTEIAISSLPTETINGVEYYVVTYTDFAAKQMCDTVTLTVCNAEGKAVSEPWTDSIQKYALRALESTSDALLRTVVVDMLNYGAACQQALNYPQANPTAEQLVTYGFETWQNCATTGLTFTEGSYATDRNNSAHWNSSNLITTSNIQFCIAFKALTENMYVTYSFTGHKGNEVSGTVTYAEMLTTTDGCPYIQPEKLVVADAGFPITVTVYDESGNVVEEWKDSIKSYAARNQTSTDDVFNAFMKFANSAYTYLHSATQLN